MTYTILVLAYWLCNKITHVNKQWWVWESAHQLRLGTCDWHYGWLEWKLFEVVFMSRDSKMRLKWMHIWNDFPTCRSSCHGAIYTYVCVYYMHMYHVSCFSNPFTQTGLVYLKLVIFQIKKRSTLNGFGDIAYHHNSWTWYPSVDYVKVQYTSSKW